MSTLLIIPNENIAASAVASMMGEEVLSSHRLAIGDQHYVYIYIANWEVLYFLFCGSTRNVVAKGSTSVARKIFV